MTRRRPGRVVVGLSGGVDSSVAALLLQEEGYDVQGLFMQNWDEEDVYCNAADDFQEARHACEQLGIPLHRISFAAAYRERVFEHFLAEHRAGRTPNPDVLCNREIKFGAFLDYARRLGAERIATGHHARVRVDEAGVAHLLEGRDQAKDQSYFLHAVPQAALAQTLFPVGELEKAEVRALARARGLRNHDRRDSTGICFIGERPIRRFLSDWLPEEPGPMVTTDGETVGEHHGLAYYTIGQRHGLGLGGRRNGRDMPWFVVAKDIERNVLVVAQGDDDPRLYADVLTAVELAWVAGPPASLPFPCRARVRYRQSARPCTIEALAEDRCTVRFAQAQRAITPGQYVVFYSGDECLGGGVIASTARDRL